VTRLHLGYRLVGVTQTATAAGLIGTAGGVTSARDLKVHFLPSRVAVDYSMPRTYGALHFSRSGVSQGHSPPHLGFGTFLVPRPAESTSLGRLFVSTYLGRLSRI
jgi:hypothetical protein